MILTANHKQLSGRQRSSTRGAGCRAFLRAIAVAVLVCTAVLNAKVNVPAPAEDLDHWMQQVQEANGRVEKGEFDKAAAIYERSLESANAADDKLRVAVVLQNLGRLLDHRGHTRAAERSYLQALRSLSEAAVRDDRLFLRVYVGLVAVYAETSQYTKVETLICRVLREHPDGALTDKASLTGSLGVALAHAGRLAEAEDVLRSTAETYATDPTPELREISAIAVANLSGIQMRLGRTAEALASYRRALGVMESLRSPSQPTFITTLRDYAKALVTSGNLSAADPVYTKAIALAKSHLGPTHSVATRLLTDYAALLRK